MSATVVADNPRIEELRRRVQKDQASIAFAQLAEEYRRAGRFAEAIDTCRVGLAHHPGYLSAHVTLGRALIETGELQLAEDELARVHVAAPENLAAIKGLAEIHHRRGDRREALALYSRALQLVPHDPELEHQIGVLTQELTAESPSRFEGPAVIATPAPVLDDDMATPEAIDAASVETAPASAPEPPPADVGSIAAAPAPAADDERVLAEAFEAGIRLTTPARAPELSAGPESRTPRQIEALERWLDAILAHRNPHR